MRALDELRPQVPELVALLEPWFYKRGAPGTLEVRMLSGDPLLVLDINGVDKFAIGVDDDDGDKFKISEGGALGSDDRVTILPSTGHVGIGMTPIAMLSSRESATLGSSQGDSQLFCAIAGCTSNYIYNALYLVRDAAGSNWLTARLHDSIRVDGSFNTPGTDTKTWWERDPYNDIQSWGNGATTYMTIDGGNVGIGVNDPQVLLQTGAGILGLNESANAGMTIGLSINQGANDDEIVALKASEVAHGMTALTETDTFMYIKKSEASSGGAHIVGLKDADGNPHSALKLTGMLGESADTGKVSTSDGVVIIEGAIKSGTSAAAVNSNGNIVVIQSWGTTKFIFDQEGEAHADVQWTTFDEHDDVTMLADFETAMLAQRDPVKAEMARFLAYNRRALEEAGIVHFDDEKPGHAMVNTTKLSMLLVGAIGQMNQRLRSLEELQLSA